MFDEIGYVFIGFWTGMIILWLAITYDNYRSNRHVDLEKDITNLWKKHEWDVTLVRHTENTWIINADKKSSGVAK